MARLKRTSTPPTPITGASWKVTWRHVSTEACASALASLALPPRVASIARIASRRALVSAVDIAMTSTLQWSPKNHGDGLHCECGCRAAKSKPLNGEPPPTGSLFAPCRVCALAHRYVYSSGDGRPLFIHTAQRHPAAAQTPV